MFGVRLDGPKFREAKFKKLTFFCEYKEPACRILDLTKCFMQELFYLRFGISDTSSLASLKILKETQS